MDWTGITVMLLISCLDSHSDGTHSLHRIYWWSSDVILELFNFFGMKKTKSKELRLNKYLGNVSFNEGFPWCTAECKERQRKYHNNLLLHCILVGLQIALFTFNTTSLTWVGEIRKASPGKTSLNETKQSLMQLKLRTVIVPNGSRKTSTEN